MDLLTRTQLHGCNTSPTATPFRRGLPVDTITDGVDLTNPSLFSSNRTQYFQEIITYKSDTALNSFLHFPLAADLPTGLSDSNWGPIDASKPKPGAKPIKHNPDSFRSVSGSLIFSTMVLFPGGHCAKL